MREAQPAQASRGPTITELARGARGAPLPMGRRPPERAEAPRPWTGQGVQDEAIGRPFVDFMDEFTTEGFNE